MPLQKPKYKIIFDTNGIFYGTPIRKDVSTFINKYKDRTKFSVDFYLPEIAAEEFRKNIFQQYNEFELVYYKGKNAIDSMLGVTLPARKKTKQSILRIVNKALRDHEFKFIKTPYKAINIKKLLSKAIWYEPPFFQEEKEKGFKDSLIWESVKSFINSQTEDVNIAFVCRDERFSKYCLKELGDKKNVKIYESVEKLESDMLLNLLQLSRAHQASLIDKAGKNFLNYFQQNNLLMNIESTFANFFINPRPTGLSGLLYERDWEPTGEMEYHIDEPTFRGKNGEKFIWCSKLTIYKRYSKSSRFINLFGTLSEKSNQSSKEYCRFEFTFQIEWEALVNEDDSIGTPHVINFGSPIINKWHESGFFTSGSVAGTSNIEDLLSIYNPTKDK